MPLGSYGQRFVDELQKTSTLHIFSPAKNLTREALVSTKVMEWSREMTLLDVYYDLSLPPTVENVRREKNTFFCQREISFYLDTFLLILRQQGLLQQQELINLCRGDDLSRQPKKFLQKPLTKRGMSDFVINSWPKYGLPYLALPDLMMRLRQRGLPLKKIVVYNHDPRPKHPLQKFANWPVVLVNHRRELKKTNLFVGERSVNIMSIK